MKSLITERLEELRSAGKKGLIPFITAGDPDLTSTIELTKLIAGAGADVIELGVPFSDPMADGPVIQQASCRALASGATLAKVLETVKEIKKGINIPLILMGYYNPVYKFGIKRFASAAAEAGVNGLIIPDLPHEESGPLRGAALEAGMDLIPLVAPTTTGERMEKIAADARGFIYCVSVTGVTGDRTEIKTDIAEFTDMVRRYTSLPLAVGFGISGPEQAARMAAHCDAVVVGSAIVRIIGECRGIATAGPVVEQLVRQIKAAL
jgi:tryptophan synthase alpha chain